MIKNLDFHQWGTQNILYWYTQKNSSSTNIHGSQAISKIYFQVILMIVKHIL